MSGRNSNWINKHSETQTQSILIGPYKLDCRPHKNNSPDSHHCLYQLNKLWLLKTDKKKRNIKHHATASLTVKWCG